jgi:hypothetical protein
LSSADDSEPNKSMSDDEVDAYTEYGKKAFNESVDTIRNFIQLMIPLISALITTYFALLQFLGIESALKSQIGSWPLIEPPIIMVISLGAFIIASFPVPWPMVLGDLFSIKGFRNAAITWKYTCTVAGAVLFLVAMATMVNLIIQSVAK